MDKVMEYKIETPINSEICDKLKSGDEVLLTGYIYTARDAAHKRLVSLLEEGKELPIDLKDSIIYYVGPTPNKENEIIGSCGPTTSYRMDEYTPKLLDLGLKGTIGKGNRSDEVIESMKKNGAVYFAAIGGAGALLSQCVKENVTVLYEDLGAEAIRRLYVENFPVIVAIDSKGNNLYKQNFK